MIKRKMRFKEATVMANKRRKWTMMKPMERRQVMARREQAGDE